MANTIPPTLGALIDQVSASASDPLTQLESAVQTAGDLSTIGDQLVGHFVDVARVAGLSWAQIGQALGGVSKQAAQQRFSPDFSRFTLRAKRAVDAAQQVAQDHGHNYIGTEHLLLGLVADPEGLAAKALETLVGSVDRVREAATAKLGNASPATGKPRFTVNAKSALTQALAEALSLGHNYIGTEHLFLGLVARTDNPPLAGEILRDLGVRYETARETVVELLSGFVKK